MSHRFTNPRRIRERMRPNLWESDETREIFNQLPLDVVIRMLTIMGPAGFQDDEHRAWNALVWEVAIWHGCLFEESL